MKAGGERGGEVAALVGEGTKTEADAESKEEDSNDKEEEEDDGSIGFFSVSFIP
jgi:hypothetical protein